MIRTLVFDFGNVVGFFDHRLASSHLARYGTRSAEELHAALFGSTLDENVEAGHLTVAQFMQELRQHWGLCCTDEQLASAYSEIFWPNPEVGALVPLLKPHYRLLLASNTSELHSRHFRRQFVDVLSHFDALVLSHEVGARKPSRAFFARCLELADAAPRECVFIDDLPTNVAGATACGMHALVYRDFRELCEQLAALGVTPREHLPGFPQARTNGDGPVPI